MTSIKKFMSLSVVVCVINLVAAILDLVTGGHAYTLVKLALRLSVLMAMRLAFEVYRFINWLYEFIK